MKSNKNKENREEILALWRRLGFLNGLKNGGIIEWRCAKSLDLMAKYMGFAETIEGDEAIKTWVVAIFPIIRRSLTKNSNRITRVINPEEIINFLKEKNIDDFLKFTSKSVHNTKSKYMIECFMRYLDSNKCLELRLIDLLTIIEKEERDKVNYIFDCDYEAEICHFITEYFCYYEKNKVV